MSSGVRVTFQTVCCHNAPAVATQLQCLQQIGECQQQIGEVLHSQSATIYATASQSISLPRQSATHHHRQSAAPTATTIQSESATSSQITDEGDRPLLASEYRYKLSPENPGSHRKNPGTNCHRKYC